ncbi:MAG: hypothetical protein CMA64_07830 [Euryarchaeota archaeon]|nr:hypothetical protein [Euryarchaeota archaeon]
MGSSLYNWLDEKLGGVLPGGVPQSQGSDPTDTANTVAKANSTTTDKNTKQKESKTATRRKVTFQQLSYPDGMDNTEEFPHQIMFNVLIRESEKEAVANSHLPEAGRGEDMFSEGMSNEGARQVVGKVAEAALFGGSVAYGLSQNLLKGSAIAGGAYLGKDWFGDKVSSLVEAKTSRRNVATIRMAMPQSPQNKMQAEWDVTDFGALMGAIAQQDGDKALKDMIRDGDFVGEGSEILMRTAAGTLNITKQLGLNLPLQSSIELMSRKVANPFKETLFKTMGFRNFPFVFKFAPKNRHELLQALKIINVFERFMAPQKSPRQLFLEYPAEFEIVYMYKGQENAYFTNFFNDTALTSFQVDYGNGGVYTAFQGTEGAPSEITMSLGFTELTLLDRDKIVDFTDQQSVMGGFDQGSMGIGEGATVTGEENKEELKDSEGNAVSDDETITENTEPK